MEVSLPFILGLAMFLTVVVLVFGVISFGVNGDFYSKHSNNLMRARVILQGLGLGAVGSDTWLAAS
ncbi:MAG: HIG1 domain-containing protein [Pseudomonadota bacterium]|nr:HIG1 domain-containing protein [Pseudomonadota bacterium]